MRYYRLSDDIYLPGRWYLGDITGIDDHWALTNGEKIDESSPSPGLSVSVYADGLEMDYTTTEAYSVPIVSDRIKDQLSEIKGLQFIAVAINGKQVSTSYFVMVVSNRCKCVDEQLSEFEKFTQNDPVRPDLAGEYSYFTELVLDRKKVVGENVFRIDNATSYLIVSERARLLLEDSAATGMKFTEL